MGLQSRKREALFLFSALADTVPFLHPLTQYLSHDLFLPLVQECLGTPALGIKTEGLRTAFVGKSKKSLSTSWTTKEQGFVAQSLAWGPCAGEGEGILRGGMLGVPWDGV